MNAVLPGVNREQTMAEHQASHIQVADAPDEAGAHRALDVQAATFAAIGLQIDLCGVQPSS